MSASELAWRSLHDLGLASWFGGSVFGTVALPHTEGTASEEAEEIEGAAWRRWTPVLTGSMAAHLVGGAGLIAWNRGRHRHQEGVALATTVKTAVTAAAVALTVGAAVDGYRTQQRRRELESGDGGADQRRAVERAEKRMRIVGPLIPAATGTLLVLGALEGEQQRPREMARGIVADALDKLPGR